mmetsp:Transcript_56774/g.169005  ORF Transcript_56774/g.169005 Transcript_56774/m.169005 type:complete len:159 (+) Transcript_56774:2-478(+)
MESNYKCSGWCTPPTSQVGSASLLQMDDRIDSHQERPVGVAARAWAFSDLHARPPALLPDGVPRTTYVYPPTLFSTLNHAATCDGMAARDMQYFLVDTADQMNYEGVYLMIISICIGFLKLLGFCMKDNIFSNLRKPGYGSTNLEEPTPRYVSQGVVQ